MNFNKLRHVIAVDRAGSVTAAAENLNLTQSTVTKSVAEIEIDLGYAIFARNAQGMQATGEGREFLHRAARIVSDMEIFTEEVKSKRQIRDKVLKIGVCPPLIGGLMNRAVLHLAEGEPDLRIHTTTMSSERCVQSLNRGDVDIAIGPSLLFDKAPDMETVPLGALHGRLFVRNGHPLTEQSQLEPTDIVSFPFITTDYSNVYANALTEIMRSEGREPISHMHVMESFPMVASLVEKTDCMAVASVDYVKTKSFQSRFTVLDLDVFQPYSLCLAHRSHSHRTKAVNALLRALRLFPVTTDSS